MRKNIIKFTVVILCIISGGILYSCRSIPDGGESFVFSESQSTGWVLCDSEVDIKSEDNETMCVYVCGAVKNPGVYILKAGDRVEAAIKAAGGFLDEADISALNLAGLIEDGQKIDVPIIGETAAEGAASLENGGLLDINKATADELMTLPGIGEAKAGQIIAYRETHGPFASVEDLKQVPGIKDGVFEPIKALICAG